MHSLPIIIGGDQMKDGRGMQWEWERDGGLLTKVPSEISECNRSLERYKRR